MMDFSEQRLAEKIESIENKIFESPEPASLDAIHSIRHRLIFLRDCYDHTVLILLMLAAGLSMLWYFKRKGWF